MKECMRHGLPTICSVCAATSAEIAARQRRSSAINFTCPVVLATTPSAEKVHWNALYVSLKKSGLRPSMSKLVFGPVAAQFQT